LDRLKGRLGKRSVLRPRIADDHQPEQACSGEPIDETPLEPRDAARSPLAAHRPLRLKPRPVAIEVLSVVPEGPPVRFHLHGTEHRVVRHWGPERIETGWWRTGDVVRDYYRVETEAGHQFWLFRERRTGAWYLHGAFD
jgi:protein ImuB